MLPVFGVNSCCVVLDFAFIGRLANLGYFLEMYGVVLFAIYIGMISVRIVLSEPFHLFVE